MSFNILNFFKKNSAVKEAEINSDQGGKEGQKVKAVKPVKEKVTFDQGITIHTMPEHYRFQHLKVDNAKTTGVLIISLGIIVLLGVSLLLYYYLFKAKPENVSTIKETPAVTAEPAAEEKNKPSGSPNEIPQGATTSATTLPGEITENLSASSTQATTSPETITETNPANFINGADSDEDGLSDLEEGLVGASLAKADSDNDGYNDLAELMNLYDPAGSGKLIASPKIKIYENGTFNYSVFYPLSLTQTVNGGDDSVMFKTADNNFVQIIVQPNIDKQTIESWYQQQFDIETIESGNLLAEKTWSGVKSSDDLIIYLTDLSHNYIYTLTYNPGTSNVLNYKNIFKMMVKTFTLTD